MTMSITNNCQLTAQLITEFNKADDCRKIEIIKNISNLTCYLPAKDMLSK